jgi:hypothetical protein
MPKPWARELLPAFKHAIKDERHDWGVLSRAQLAAEKLLAAITEQMRNFEREAAKAGRDLRRNQNYSALQEREARLVAEIRTRAPEIGAARERLAEAEQRARQELSDRVEIEDRAAIQAITEAAAVLATALEDRARLALAAQRIGCGTRLLCFAGVDIPSRLVALDVAAREALASSAASETWVCGGERLSDPQHAAGG